MVIFHGYVKLPEGNIYHQYTPNVSIYTSTMDPIGFGEKLMVFLRENRFGCFFGSCFVCFHNLSNNIYDLI